MFSDTALSDLHPHVADEVFSIGREAITNAFRHADASTIAVVLSDKPARSN